MFAPAFHQNKQSMAWAQVSGLVTIQTPHLSLLKVLEILSFCCECHKNPKITFWQLESPWLRQLWIVCCDIQNDPVQIQTGSPLTVWKYLALLLGVLSHSSSKHSHSSTISQGARSWSKLQSGLWNVVPAISSVSELISWMTFTAEPSNICFYLTS